MTKIFIVVPANAISGGPELSHQLADILNQNGQRAFIVYLPANQRWDIPWCYQKYRADTAAITDIKPGSIVVLPELATELVTQFPGSRIYFWWMSVDGFLRTAAARCSTAADDLTLLRHHVTRHLYQSEYARNYLESEGLTPASRLSDRLSEQYLQAITTPPDRKRRNLIAYNPKKGIDRTQKILEELATRNWAGELIGIAQMFRPNQVRDVLAQVKVYIDFGDHPGKERLPREAAACGACVLTNRRGSAANPVDVPILEAFKIDDQVPGFEHHVVDAIVAVMGDFDHQQPRFDDYRRRIAAESDEFAADIAAVF